MANKRRESQNASETREPVTGAWVPPKGAEQLDLAEFYKPTERGETVLGRITRTTKRPDPMHDGRFMYALVLTPAVLFVPEQEPTAYASLAIGLSAHLQLLLGDPDQQIGNAFAFTYDGTRPSAVRGQNPSHQWIVTRLTESQFRSEVGKVVGESDDLPF